MIECTLKQDYTMPTADGQKDVQFPKGSVFRMLKREKKLTVMAHETGNFVVLSDDIENLFDWEILGKIQ